MRDVNPPRSSTLFFGKGMANGFDNQKCFFVWNNGEVVHDNHPSFEGGLEDIFNGFFENCELEVV